MGKAEAAMAMVATAPCQAEAWAGRRGGGGGEEGGVGGGDVAVTKRVTVTTEARRRRWRWWRWCGGGERVAVKAEVERAACAAGGKRGAPSGLMARAVGEREDEVAVDP